MSRDEKLAAILKEHLGWHGARTSFLAKFIIALLHVRTVNLTEVAVAFGGRAQSDSHYKRMQRFFRFFAIDEAVLARFIARLLPIRDEPWVLTMDRTNWKFGKKNINILLLGIAYKGAALPLFLDDPR